MSLTESQRQTFEERLGRIKVGGENTAGEIHVGPREMVRAKDKKKQKPKSRNKSRKLPKAQEGSGPLAVMLPLGIFLGALSLSAGQLTNFHLFAPEGLGQFTPPIPEVALFGHFLIGGILALLFTWAFEMDSLLRKMAVVAGFAAMVYYETQVIALYPDVYATFFSEGYVADRLG